MEAVWQQVAEAHTAELRTIANRVGQRLMYGTDISPIDRWDLSVDLCRSALPEEELRTAIMGGTAERIFHLN